MLRFGLIARLWAGALCLAVGCVNPLSLPGASFQDDELAQGVLGGMSFLGLVAGQTYSDAPLLRVSTPPGTDYVVYSADGFLLAVATDEDSDYAARVRFQQTGPRTLTARAFADDDRQVGEVSLAVILDPNVEDEGSESSGASGAGPAAPTTVSFLSPATEGGTYLNGVWLKVAVDGDVRRVRYLADGFVLGERDDASDDYALRYTFTALGERELLAQALSATGAVLAEASRTIRVVDEAGNGGVGSATTRSGIAAEILGHHDGGRLTLWNQSFGRYDGADPRSNIADTAAGGDAKTSCYGTAPCNQVSLSMSLLRAMRSLREQKGYNYFVTSIAGANHSYGSLHYAGRAFDIDEINGVRVYGDSAAARAFMNACWSLGAVEVFGPSNDPYGHYDHIHCGF